jgi:glycosyltransferase involved in cell wall biosynthesis
MPPFLAILLIAGASGSLVGLTYWSVVLYHIARTARSIPTARGGLALTLPTPAPRVCVVIPAHNEERNIVTVAQTLLAQDYPADRLGAVFALDRCTDATEPALRAVVEHDPRMVVHRVETCPPDWAGKVNALWQAVTTEPACQSADYLLFVDADTALDPACVRSTVAIAHARSLGMLTLLSTLTDDTWFERRVQPAAAFELVRQYPLDRAARGDDSRRAFANGQFILFSRAAYDAIGGHHSVRGQIFEDVKIAQQVAQKNIPAGVLLADTMLRCRMYSDYEAFSRGWRRIYSEAANRKPWRLRRSARRLRCTSTLFPLAGAVTFVLSLGALALTPLHALTTTALGISLGALVAYWLAVLAIYRMGNTPTRLMAWYPLGAWAVGGILRHAARDLETEEPIRWGGREYANRAR